MPNILSNILSNASNRNNKGSLCYAKGKELCEADYKYIEQVMNIKKL